MFKILFSNGNLSVKASEQLIKDSGTNFLESFKLEKKINFVCEREIRDLFYILDVYFYDKNQKHKAVLINN